MGVHDVAGDGEDEPGPAAPRRASERLEHMKAGRFGNAGSGVGDFDHRCLRGSRGADRDRTGSEPHHRLGGVAGQIEKDPKHLFAVADDREIGGDVVAELDPLGQRQRQRGADVAGEIAEIERLAVEHDAVAAAVAE